MVSFHEKFSTTLTGDISYQLKLNKFQLSYNRIKNDNEFIAFSCFKLNVEKNTKINQTITV